MSSLQDRVGKGLLNVLLDRAKFFAQKLPPVYRRLQEMDPSGLPEEGLLLPRNIQIEFARKAYLLTQLESLNQYNIENYKKNYAEVMPRFWDAIVYEQLWHLLLLNELWRKVSDVKPCHNLSFIIKTHLINT
jgi:hypothetical protein